jgi:phage/plasmid-like protein (TIGR03299 family)
VLAKLNRDPLVIAEGDTVEKFILLSHGHDGSLAVRCGFTPIRVVCANTLAMAHGCDNSKLIRLKHTKDVLENLANVREIMDLANQEFEATAEQYRLLARKSINQADLRKYVRRVLKVEDGEQPGTRLQHIADEIARLADVGRGNSLSSIRGTYWSAYNGVSEWLTYNRGRGEDNRLNSLWFGLHDRDFQGLPQCAVQAGGEGKGSCGLAQGHRAVGASDRDMAGVGEPLARRQQ